MCQLIKLLKQINSDHNTCTCCVFYYQHVDGSLQMAIVKARPF